MASPTINLNDSLPAAPAGGVNVKWQSVASVHGAGGPTNVTAYIPTTALPTGSPTGTLHSLVFDGNTPFGNTNQLGVSWENYGAGSGTFAINSTGVSGSNPGNWKLTSGTASYGCIKNDAVSNQIDLNIFAQFQAYVALGGTSSGGYWIGFSSLAAASLSATNPNGSIVAFRFIQGTDTHYQAYVGTATGTFTAVDTGIAPDTNFHQLKIQQDNSGNLTFYIDGTLVATISAGATGIPSGSTAMSEVIDCYVGSSTVTMLVHSVVWWSKF